MKIVWEERGSGAPLLLVQGLGYARWSWEPILPGLAERYHVLFFDNRGIGESDKPDGPYTAGEMAADALQVLDEAGVDKLVLCCTTPGTASMVPMPAVTVQLFQEAATLAPEVALRRFVENALGPGAPLELVDELYRKRVENPLDPAGWQAQAAAGTTYPGPHGDITQPTLLLTGTADNVVDPGNTDVLADRIPGARVEKLEGAGHLFFWEQPDAVVRIVTEFLG